MSVNYIQIQVTAGFLMTPNWALGGLLRLKITKTAFVDVAGLGLSDQKNTARRDHAHRCHRHRLQNLHEPQKKWALESPAGEIS